MQEPAQHLASQPFTIKAGDEVDCEPTIVGSGASDGVGAVDHMD